MLRPKHDSYANSHLVLHKQTLKQHIEEENINSIKHLIRIINLGAINCPAGRNGWNNIYYKYINGTETCPPCHICKINCKTDCKTVLLLPSAGYSQALTSEAGGWSPLPTCRPSTSRAGTTSIPSTCTRGFSSRWRRLGWGLENDKAALPEFLSAGLNKKMTRLKIKVPSGFNRIYGWSGRRPPAVEHFSDERRTRGTEDYTAPGKSALLLQRWNPWTLKWVHESHSKVWIHQMGETLGLFL